MKQFSQKWLKGFNSCNSRIIDPITMAKMLGVIILMTFTKLGLAQSQEITGKVISGEDQLPIPGATVLVKGSSTGTVTDFEGNYSLNVSNPAEAILSFSLWAILVRKFL
ncbi:carboxypeptidase-like regulatory domain-containing protein [Echinicola jeungdonensis]|uniref:carboxypeptidase-like regulatory domain-containing protein n=1 Tax=Echinicola jeungdonensis TaxID=709343 RepID=UPI0025B2E48F|nr:carboxypeptidase-like regulatory domain-containing protein [Echinicola jeungdonensis]MDN3670320.1 carboxypeptidase-like regulatory domain-containing protein [Echinicola jeungdonensis]